jgi:hypothetical protein
MLERQRGRWDVTIDRRPDRTLTSDQPVALQSLQRRADRGPADIEHPGQIILGW